MSADPVVLTPGRKDVLAYRGDTVALPFVINEGDPPVPADISARAYRAQLRKSGQLVYDFDVDILDGPGGELVIRLTAEQTAILGGKYQWDLEQTTGDVVRTLVRGEWTVAGDSSQ